MTETPQPATSTARVDVVHAGVPPFDGTLRARIAPAPSGELHVGNVRTALFSWALARHAGGTFLVRVEDTDASRVTDAYVEALQRDLAWIGIDWDEGPGVGGPFAPYRQSERSEVYAEAVARLLATGAAYRAFDTPEELEAQRAAAASSKKPFRYDGSRWRALSLDESDARAATEPFVVRFAMPPGTTTWKDLVRGEVRIDHREIPDFTLTRAGGQPLYMLAAAVDDVAMGLTHIVRGEDLISAVPRQLALYAALGQRQERWPAFAHLPLINGDDGKPLSKRNGETSLSWYREHGFLPEALRNYLGQLGWSMPGDREFFTVEEFLAAFSLDRVQKAAARFDLKKLEALNGEWIRALPVDELGARVRPLLVEAGLPVDEDVFAAALPELGSRLRRLTDAVELLRPLLVEEDFAPDSGDADTVLTSAALPALEAVVAALADPDLVWEAEALIARLRAVLLEGLGLKPKTAFAPLYVSVAGRRSGLPINALLALLGRERSLQRLRAGLARAAASGTG